MKHIKYLKYLVIHKWYVLIECFRCGLYWQGITHDLSKFLPSEFFPYAEFFYGTKRQEEFFEYYGKAPYYLIEAVPYGLLVKDKFQIAWLHHQKRNKHHWQYWMLQEDDGNSILIPMPDKYRKEMLADWRGAGMAISGKDNTLEWYEKNKENIKINSQTRQWVEEQLKATNLP